MFLSASSLDRLVDLQITSSVRGPSGAAKPAPATTIPDVPAAYEPVRGYEQIRAGEVLANFDARFYLRWRNDIAAKDTIIHEGREYDIYDVQEFQGRRQFIEVLAKARGV